MYGGSIHQHPRRERGLLAIPGRAASEYLVQPLHSNRLLQGQDHENVRVKTASHRWRGAVAPEAKGNENMVLVRPSLAESLVGISVAPASHDCCPRAVNGQLLRLKHGQCPLVPRDAVHRARA